MSRAAAVPDAAALLCERCGYVLSGLPDDGNCPECGSPIADSFGVERRPAAFERDPNPLTFLGTTAAVIGRPRHFYRTLSIRYESRAERRFAQLHWGLAALLFGFAGASHLAWYWTVVLGKSRALLQPHYFGVALALLAVVAYAFVYLTTVLAARLSAWEGAYRGYRLPFPVVMRALHFHAAHYLPVALAAAGTCGAYAYLTLFRGVGITSPTTYLYLLSGEIVLAAFYLFETYWVGMRNSMYANR